MFDFYSYVDDCTNLVNSCRTDTPSSCFPIVPKLACQHMDLPFTNSARPITILGGLTSFGGAGNNYSMHVSISLIPSIADWRDKHPLTSMLQALTAMVRKLRTGHGRNGLILANGGVLTYQHALCLSTGPRRDGSAYPNQNPFPSHVMDIPVPAVTAHAEGEAVVEVSVSGALSERLSILLIWTGY